jgi:hypothetical protein
MYIGERKHRQSISYSVYVCLLMMIGHIYLSIYSSFDSSKEKRQNRFIYLIVKGTKQDVVVVVIIIFVQDKPEKG